MSNFIEWQAHLSWSEAVQLVLTSTMAIVTIVYAVLRLRSIKVCRCGATRK